MPKETAELSVSSPEPQAETSSFLDKLNPPAGGHKFKILGGALLVLGFAGVIFGVYKLGQRQIRPGPQPTPTPAAVATPTPDPTANWETYVSTAHGFAIKYPAGVELKEQEDGTVTLSLWGPTQKPETEFYDGISLGFRSGSLTGKTLKEFVDEKVGEAKASGLAEILSFPNQIIVGGLTGYSFKTRGLGEFTYIYLPRGEEGYIEITDGTVDPTGQGFQETTEEILSTFRLSVEESPTSVTTPTPKEFTCPPEGTLDCMPGPDRPELKYCTSEYSAWIETNCPGVEIVW